MNTALTTTNGTTNYGMIEQVMLKGNLTGLNDEQRTKYYFELCKSLGLNPITRPFEYITLSGKLVLYAKKDAAEQLRKINNISIGKPDIQFEDDLIIVTVTATDKTGRNDSDTGVVTCSGRGDVKANAIMKAITKAKRRVTLSISGLGMLDETELETIHDEPVIIRNQTSNDKPQKPFLPTLTFSKAIDELNAMRESGKYNHRRLTELFEFACKQTQSRGMSCEERPTTALEAANSVAIMVGRCEDFDAMQSAAAEYPDQA